LSWNLINKYQRHIELLLRCPWRRFQTLLTLIVDLYTSNFSTLDKSASLNNPFNSCNPIEKKGSQQQKNFQ
jgi:hypothetical protein